MKTPYKIAFEKFRHSEECKKLILQYRSDNKVETSQHDFFYENRIRVAFDAGWNARQEALIKEMQKS